MPDASAPAESQPKETTPTENSDMLDASQTATAAPSSTIQHGRRRGRRRVTKQKKVKDEDGYLGEWRRRVGGLAPLTKHVK